MNDTKYILCCFGLLLIVYLVPSSQFLLNESILWSLPCRVTETEMMIKLNASSFTSYKVKNVYQCIILAMKIEKAHFLNYNIRTNDCQLNSGGINSNKKLEFVSDEEYVFIQFNRKTCNNNFEEKRVCDIGECRDVEACLSVNSNKETLCKRMANGNWGSWSSYTQCTVTCGGGTTSRTRLCNSPTPVYAGTSCKGSDTETQNCNVSECPVNGNWGSWSTYTQCTVTCGGGTQTRSRSCDNPSPSYGGTICPGTTTEIIECNTSVCPVDGNWGTWSSYNQCTVTCGGGTQTRSRSCDNPSPSNGGNDCVGSSTENQACSSSLCPVNGNWGSWSSYSQCSVTCGSGTKTRTRVCDNPTPSNGGSGCVGSSSENPTCNTSPCPAVVDGNWGTWSSYNQCSVTCGGGTQTRSRSCDNPSPSNGGNDCVGSSTENQACSSSLCPVNGNWGSWSSYSQCSVTCGSGTKTRTRVCDNPTPSNGGSGCVGSSSENPTCNTSPCPDAVCYSKSGYDYNGSTRTCIKISSSSKTFDNAKSECESEGGTLFKMDSVSKRDFLKSLVENKGISDSGLFIGARDAGTLEYKWLDGTNVNWIGNPPTTNDQNCVRYDISSSEMDETFCTNNLKYICEQTV